MSEYAIELVENCDYETPDDNLRVEIIDFITYEENCNDLDGIAVKKFRKHIPMMLLYCFFYEKRKNKKGI